MPKHTYLDTLLDAYVADVSSKHDQCVKQIPMQQRTDAMLKANARATGRAYRVFLRLLYLDIGATGVLPVR